MTSIRCCRGAPLVEPRLQAIPSSNRVDGRCLDTQQAADFMRPHTLLI